jgi:hypothetical protein
MKARSLRIKLIDRPSLHLQEWGYGDRACLLIHGFGDGSYVWNEFAPSLASHYHTFAIDLRGHGDSEWDRKADYDVRTHVADVVEVIRTFQWDGVALVGRSMGGDIAIRAAIDCHECILGGRRLWSQFDSGGNSTGSRGILRRHPDISIGFGLCPMACGTAASCATASHRPNGSLRTVFTGGWLLST